jgi:hypothetical protein
MLLQAATRDPASSDVKNVRALGTADALDAGMTSLVLATALLIRTQSPEQDVALELRDPFVEVEPLAARVQLPSELVDPFSRRAPARALTGQPRTVPSDLVDPFAQRRARAERIPSQLRDPFADQS